MGTNSIDNAARVCHSPSTFGLKDSLGVAATTCSYTDWIGSDLVVFIGSNVANNQPVAMKYLYHAKKAGTKIAVVNPYREPGMERYWVPSNVESALFGTKIADRYFLINVGGDIGFLNGALKHMIEQGLAGPRLHRATTPRASTGSPRRSTGSPGRSWRPSPAPRGRDGGVRRHARQGQHRGAGLEHGRHPARVRRGQRPGDHQPRADQGVRRPRQVRADADPRPLRRAGRRRDGRLCDRAARRAADRRGERGPLLGAVGLRGAARPPA